MDEILSRIESGARSRGENLRLVLKVKEGTQAYYKHDLYISISDTHFDVYQVGGSLSVKAYSWFTLRKILLKETTLLLEFNTTKISFISPQMADAYEVILTILPRILNSSELLFSGILRTNSMPKPNPNTAILRLKQKVKYGNVQQQDKAVKSIIETLRYSIFDVDLSKFEDQKNALPLFADILPLLPNIRSISMRNINLLDAYKCMLDVTSNTGSLDHIEINGETTQSFEKFMNALINNLDSNVRNLTFNGAQFSEKQLSVLLSFMRTRSCSSLSLIDSVPANVLNYFYSQFITDASLSDLIELRLEKTYGLNLYSILPSIANITILSLADCALDLNKTLSKFSKQDFPNLTALNLSKNLCVEQLNSSHKLPKNLSTLMLDEMELPDETLITLFSLLKKNRKEKFRLSICKVTASKKSWTALFEYLLSIDKYSSMFSSLVWDNNKVSESFFTFLRNQTKLEYLSLNGCFSEKEKADVDSVSSFIQENRTIKSFSISGDEEKYLGASLKTVIASIRKRETKLDYLDIGNNKCGDEGIEEMKQLLECCIPPRIIIIDGSEPVKSKAITEFLNFAFSSNVDACISFPKRDLDYLARLKRLTSDQYTKIKEMYMIPEGPDSKSPFDAPFSIYIEEKNQKFPKYVNREQTRVQYVYNSKPSVKPSIKTTLDDVFDFSPKNVPKTPSARQNYKKNVQRRNQTLDPDDLQQFHDISDKQGARKRSASPAAIKSKPKVEKKSFISQKENQELTHLVPLHILSESSSINDKNSFSNVAAVSSRGSLSINEDYYNRKQEEEEIDEKPTDKVKESKVARLTPNASFTRLIPPKREKHLSAAKPERLSLPIANNSQEKRKDSIPVREPQSPPDSGSPRRPLKQHSPIQTPESFKEISIIKQPPNPLYSNKESPLVKDVQGSSDASFDKKEKKEKESNEQEINRSDWEFPIQPFIVPDKWKQLNDEFSLEENVKEIAKLPHFHYTEK